MIKNINIENHINGEFYLADTEKLLHSLGSCLIVNNLTNIEITLKDESGNLIGIIAPKSKNYIYVINNEQGNMKYECLRFLDFLEKI